MTGYKLDRIFKRNHITSQYIIDNWMMLKYDDFEFEIEYGGRYEDGDYEPDRVICNNEESLYETFCELLMEDDDFWDWLKTLKGVSEEYIEQIKEGEIDVDLASSKILGDAYDSILEEYEDAYYNDY